MRRRGMPGRTAACSAAACSPSASTPIGSRWRCAQRARTTSISRDSPGAQLRLRAAHAPRARLGAGARRRVARVAGRIAVMLTPRQQSGKRAEDLAARVLRARGCEMLRAQLPPPPGRARHRRTRARCARDRGGAHPRARRLRLRRSERRPAQAAAHHARRAAVAAAAPRARPPSRALRRAHGPRSRRGRGPSSGSAMRSRRHEATPPLGSACRSIPR